MLLEFTYERSTVLREKLRRLIKKDTSNVIYQNYDIILIKTELWGEQYARNSSCFRFAEQDP